MGTDNLFHKRKARTAGDLARHKAKREPYDKVLIVCEGEKTEPNYFNGLKDYHGLNSANIEVCGNCGSDPLSIVAHGKQRYREEKDAGDPFNRVYCVFDKDNHANYYSAVDQIASASPKNTYFAITSVPCFEYWLLLHFIYTTRPYELLGGNSACNQILYALQEYLPGYSKGHRLIFEELKPQLEFAIRNAERALNEARTNHTDNPTTRIHELVAYLKHIKDPK